MYYAVVVLAGFIFLSGMIAGRNRIYTLIESTIALLNAILDDRYDDEIKQKLLVKGLGKLLVSLVIVLMIFALILGLTIVPLLLFGYFTGISSDDWDVHSFYFYAALTVGSIVPFFIFQATQVKRDYSEWSVLLHRIALNNYNLARYLFKLEQRWFKKKLTSQRNDFVIISGLARAGTTALTTVLHATGKFHSLSYANMPFLISPNSWGKFYKPKDENLRERSHGDKVMFGYNSVEALEEFFWKVQLDDAYTEGENLLPHEVDENVYRQYLVYQQLLRLSKTDETLYLAKNNNFILRYPSLRKVNKEFKVIFLFRDPLDHAYSLLNQHNRYCKYQQQDGFVLEYMNWLGHHEFGLNQKKFKLTDVEGTLHDRKTLNYWLQSWIEYYASLIPMLKDDPHAILVEYRDFANQPEKVLGILERELNLTFGTKPDTPFEGATRTGMMVEEAVKEKAYQVYQQLLAIKKS